MLIAERRRYRGCVHVARALHIRKDMVNSSSASPSPETTEPVRAHTIVVIEDEPQIRRAVKHALATFADRVLEAASGEAGIACAAAERPDLVVLDLGLPDMPGLEVCKALRRLAAMPIVVLSVRDSEQDKVALLNAGADDYITKPFSTLEFAARARAQLRRAHLGPRGALQLEVGELTIDLARRRVTRAGGESAHLTPTEWNILRTLAAQAGRTLTHQQIYDAVWGRRFGNPQQYLRVYITNLRRKIEANPTHPRVIVTEPGVGYRLELPPLATS